MANFNNETNYFFSIIQSAINKTELAKPSDDLDWNLLFEYAEKQDVFGILADTIPKEFLDSETKTKLNNYEKSQIVHMIAMNNELKQIEAELNKLGIGYMLLKGARIRDFYPKQIMRQMGDFDLMYDISNQEKLIKMMTSRGYKLTSNGGNSDDFNKTPFYTFEFHHDLFKDVYGFCPDFSFVWERAEKVEGTCEYKMTIEDIYLHSLAHMYKHFVFGGFGIRFIIDNYLIIKQFGDSFDEEYISMRIDEMKLQDFRKTVDEFSISFFEGELNETQIKFANERLLAGVYGSHIENVEEIYKRFQGNGKKSVFGFIIQRIFPSKEQMISNYPKLKDKIYLLPIYYIIRIFTKSTNGVKKVINEIKSINKLGDK